MDLVRVHDHVIFMGPKGNLFLKPEKVKEEEVEKICGLGSVCRASEERISMYRCFNNICKRT